MERRIATEAASPTKDKVRYCSNIEQPISIFYCTVPPSLLELDQTTLASLPSGKSPLITDYPAATDSRRAQERGATNRLEAGVGGLELPSSQLSGVVFAGSTVSMAEHRRVGFLSRRFVLIQSSACHSNTGFCDSKYE